MRLLIVDVIMRVGRRCNNDALYIRIAPLVATRTSFYVRALNFSPIEVRKEVLTRDVQLGFL